MVRAVLGWIEPTPAHAQQGRAAKARLPRAVHPQPACASVCASSCTQCPQIVRWPRAPVGGDLRLGSALLPRPRLLELGQLARPGPFIVIFVDRRPGRRAGPDVSGLGVVVVAASIGVWRLVVVRRGFFAVSRRSWRCRLILDICELLRIKLASLPSQSAAWPTIFFDVREVRVTTCAAQDRPVSLDCDGTVPRAAHRKSRRRDCVYLAP